MSNLYWQMYKSLEREVLNLSDQVHFDDKQLNVYSLKISDLLTRCAIEIEAISKELYKQNGGDMSPKKEDGTPRSLFFDEDCIALLNKLWALDKKEVIVSAANFYFTKDENRILTPLKKAHIRGSCDWKKAYQAVKHNRISDLEKGNIKNLVRALAALYIFNIYYRNDKFELGTKPSLNDSSLGSDVFSFSSVVVCPKYTQKKVNIPSESTCAVYIIKSHDLKYSDYQKETRNAFQEQRRILAEKSSEEPKDRNELFKEASNVSVELTLKMAEIENSMNTLYNNFTYEAVLNTNQTIFSEESINGKK